MRIASPMTPTEQDKELREAVWASLASQMTHAINCTNPEHTKQNSCVDFTDKNFDQLMQLITAHTNAEIAKVLDRLIDQEWRFGEHDSALAVPTRYIKAERDKLKEANQMTNYNEGDCGEHCEMEGEL